MSVSQTIEDSCKLDLVYVTERIIAVSFPSTANEEHFRSNLREVAQMLKSKHGGNYLVRMGLSLLSQRPSALSACHLTAVCACMCMCMCACMCVHVCVLTRRKE